MRFWFLPVLIFWLIGFSQSLTAQSLNDSLLKEAPEKLARDAHERGDIVRGAILFHQGNIACAKCHQGTAEAARLGPDLSKLGDDATDIHIVESILQPSKKIREGYETVVALTIDGETVTGIVVEENKEQITLRDGNDIERRIVVLREDLEAIRPGEKSNMPAELANQLKDRQQFLDLLKYVFDLKGREPAGNLSAVPSVQIRRELKPELEGLVSIQKRNCVACHHSDNELLATSKQAPKLSWSAKWLNPAYLESFIAAPHATKPGTTMPELLGDLTPEQRRKTAKSMAHFLISKTGTEFRPSPIDAARIESGKSVFHSVGCVACHAPRDEAARELKLSVSFDAESIALGDLQQKYNVEGLTRFLEDPLAVRASGHMPNMLLTHREAVDVANYLLQPNSSAPAPEQDFDLDSNLAKEGRLLFQKYNCHSCHAEVAPELGAPAKKRAFAQLRSNHGCLSEQPEASPVHNWQAGEREAVQAAMAKSGIELPIQERIEVALRQFNCIACHQRGDLGGVADDRRQFFETTNLNLGEQGKIPPGLTGVGAKLKPEWMRDVFVNGRSIRPYMKTRMPQFGEANVGHLVSDFREVDRLPPVDFEQITDQKKVREEGLNLVGNRGLNCVACHTFQFKISDTMPAVDLTEMAERLEKDWFYHYMLAPQKFSPNTVMPTFWPNGKAIRSDLTGTPQDQIDAIWLYLLDGRQARAPRGIVQKPLEIAVTEKAEMLRRKYPGIGKRGIGVGYPGGINIAFDAEQMRLGLLWKGGFADPGGVWRGQGSGNVRPLGRPVELPKGPDIDLSNDPWQVDDGRPPNHQFRGYVLDSQNRPTFRYEVSGVTVEDMFRPLKTEDGSVRLHRVVKITAGDSSRELRFRIAAGKKIDSSTNGFQCDPRLAVEIDAAFGAQVVQQGDQQWLQIPLKIEPGTAREIELDYVLD